MCEVWLPVIGSEFYEVSSLGRVRSLRRSFKGKTKDGLEYTYTKSGRVLKPGSNLGYEQVVVLINGQRRTCLVSRLVALAFLPNPEQKPYVNHIDGNRANNKLENLEWVTAEENTRHAMKHGLFNPTANGLKNKERLEREKQ
jgi:hypothetical protein